MFDIGFWEILVIAVVLLLVMGPERLPEVAKQAAFFVRKARQSMFALRNEMRSELGGDPLAGLKDARQEMSKIKNDFKQFGRDLADSHEEDMQLSSDAMKESNEMSESANALGASKTSTSATKKVSSKKKTSTKKKTTKKKATKKVTQKSNKKKATKSTPSKTSDKTK